MLYSQGGVQLNGVPSPSSMAIFPGDLVQTERGWMAKLTARGTDVTVESETIVRFEGNYLVLDHGSVAVDTSQILAVQVECLTVIPLRMERTQYEVSDVDGKVSIIARKSDLNINRTKDRKLGEENGKAELASLREGERETREDKCASAAPSGQSAASLKGPLVDSVWVKGGGVAGIAALACWVLCRSDNPISPNVP